MLGFGPGMLEEFRVVDTSGTGGHAREAAETEIHFVRERFGGFKAVISDGAHEGDASAWAVALKLGGVVGGAGGQAKAAVHALLDDRVVQSLEMGMRGGTVERRSQI